MRPPAAFSRYWALARKELQQVWRNRKLMIQLTVPPALLPIVLGYALNPDVQDLRLGVVDLDGGERTREVVARLDALETFEVQAQFVSPPDAARALERREIDMALVFPPDLSRDLAAGRPGQVQALVDAVTANSAAVASGRLRQMIARYGVELVGPPGLELDRAPELRSTTLYNPGLVFQWYYLTGLIPIIVFVDGSLVASAVAVREKEIGTLEQLLMSPAQSGEIILAKTTPVIALLVTGLLLARTTAWLWFDLPLRGSFLLFLLGTVLAAIAAVGVGTLIGTFAETQQQAQFLAFFINPPAVFLSGAFTRIENMPEALQAFSVVVPLRYFVNIVRDVSLKGAGLQYLWDDVAVLGAMGAALYLVSALRFRRQLR